ncbi:hypothetical protein O6H91_15G015900 [Diphasiastrum complanatum]|uniref:Uncharacterized protein n=1 Tax=Diphasiastrum complanatum TaxID=34168 RepID=A0ACC2BG49_DIPCM|nr:hypothetical protein O6H91_15G015900 [Diphasiastrum complanatum]
MFHGISFFNGYPLVEPFKTFLEFAQFLTMSSSTWLPMSSTYNLPLDFEQFKKGLWSSKNLMTIMVLHDFPTIDMLHRRKCIINESNRCYLFDKIQKIQVSLLP